MRGLPCHQLLYCSIDMLLAMARCNYTIVQVVVVLEIISLHLCLHRFMELFPSAFVDIDTNVSLKSNIGSKVYC